ncbi:MAG: hypothetical protein C5B47_03385 [Verrucomicrobia bacterium]|nr:MAG: hypothetical protein C5B47_03385 [Verrucomicrobiota bacterium]
MPPEDSRSRILARIREALRKAAPPRHLNQHGGHPVAASPLRAENSQWLPPVPDDWEGQVELFAKNAIALKAEWMPCHSPKELTENLQQLAISSRWLQIGTHSLPFGQEAVDFLSLPQLRTDLPFATQELERCDVGITSCECLISQTGSALISSTNSGGRALSVLPPHHVVIAHKSQLVPDLNEAFRSLRVRYGDNLPPYLSFITGPSRTGDIERILVLGAHGPKRLSILFASYSETSIK